VSISSWPPQSRNFALFFFGYYGFIGVFSPYASLYFVARGMSATQVGVLLSLAQAVRIFGPGMWGWIADHRQERAALLRFAGAAALLSFCGILWGDSFWHFLAVILLLNIFNSAQGPLSEALMLACMRGDLSHYGKLRLWGSVGFIAAVLVAGKLTDRYGIETMPWVALSLLAAMFCASLFMRESGVSHARPAAGTVRAILARREVQAFFVSTFLMIGAHAALYVFYSLYLAELGYSNSVIGLMWSLGVLAEIVFFYYQAPIFRRFGVRNMMIGCLLIAALRFLMIGFGAEVLAWLLLAQLMHAATFAVHHSAAVATLQRWFSGPLQSRGQGLYFSISYGLGGTLGGLTMSLFWDTFGGRAVYLVAALFALAGAVAAWLSYRWQTQREQSIRKPLLQESGT